MELPAATASTAATPHEPGSPPGSPRPGRRELGASPAGSSCCLSPVTAASRGSPSSPPSLAFPPTPAAGSGDGAGDRRAWRLDDFDLGPRLGAGAFGHVRLAHERGSGTAVALKLLKKRRLERLAVQRHVAHEIEIQAHLRHAGILRLFGFFWDASSVYMILECAHGGDLQRLLQEHPGRGLGEERAAGFVAQALSALRHCHRLHVIHRDVKPQNLLVAAVGSGRLKLADFGWAVHTYPSDRRWTLCGTLDYLPPEMVHVTNGHSFGVDVWALGVLAYELLVGRPPFTDPVREETYRRILDAAPCFPDGLSEGPRGFVAQLLRRDEGDRAPLSDAQDNPWLAKSVEQTVEGGLAALAGG